MKILIIGNPIAGGGRAGVRIGELAGILTGQGHEVEACLTGAAGDGARRAGRIDADTDVLVVVGGDGTLNEILNGLDDPSRVPVAQLPTGTANVLARELSLPKTPRLLAEIVDRRCVQWLDIGLVGERRFLMMVSAGFDAMVIEEVQRTRRGSLGFRGYVKPILRVLARRRRFALRVRVDGQPPVPGALAVVSHVRTYGGLFHVTDRARVGSGHLDVVVLPSDGIPDLLRFALRGLTRRLSRSREAIYLTGRRIRIESAGDPVPVQVDGEFWGQTPADIRLHPRRLPMIVP